MSLHRYRRIPISIWMVLGIVLAFTGCGRKAPPLPPQNPDLPKAEGIATRIQDDVLTLTWRVPEKAGQSGLAGYLVERAAGPADKTGCPGCLGPYETRAQIPFEAGKTALRFQESLKSGSFYHYRLTPFDAQGRFGAAADVQVSY